MAIDLWKREETSSFVFEGYVRREEDGESRDSPDTSDQGIQTTSCHEENAIQIVVTQPQEHNDNNSSLDDDARFFVPSVPPPPSLTQREVVSSSDEVSFSLVFIGIDFRREFDAFLSRF